MFEPLLLFQVFAVRDQRPVAVFDLLFDRALCLILLDFITRKCQIVFTFGAILFGQLSSVLHLQLCKASTTWPASGALRSWNVFFSVQSHRTRF